MSFCLYVTFGCEMEDFITIEEHSTLSNKTKVKSWNKNDGPLRNKTKPLGLSTLGKKAK